MLAGNLDVNEETQIQTSLTRHHIGQAQICSSPTFVQQQFADFVMTSKGGKHEWCRPFYVKTIDVEAHRCTFGEVSHDLMNQELVNIKDPTQKE